jgi:NADPH:quinone reductase-like Zn-dependent oxidoreductase
MRGIVVERPGGPEVLQFRTVPTPELRPGWILFKVKAFGLNRSEMFTKQGYSPGVKFPRIPGIECVGIVKLHHQIQVLWLVSLLQLMW